MTDDGRERPLREVATTLTDRDVAAFRRLRRMRIIGGENAVRYRVRIKVGKPLDRPPELPELPER